MHWSTFTVFLTSTAASLILIRGDLPPLFGPVITGLLPGAQAAL